MQKSLANLIFTNHALERLSLRNISQQDILEVVSSPDKVFPGRDGGKKFIGTIRGRRIHVVTTKVKNQDKWLIVSVWVRGEDDPVPLAWKLISWPFKAVWWVIKTLLKTIFGKSKSGNKI